MLPVCIGSYPTSVLRYKVLILDVHHPDILYSHEQGCEDPWLFFEAKTDPQAKKFGKLCPKRWLHLSSDEFAKGFIAIIEGCVRHVGF